eukprot:CAMPEP_0115858568 /NCGR_PEP_ID=MMETSP0287-20121206/16166_1 /TAXON_ID=412157 /ORGANISM="Chrysochromulina rotalis, Strain UIO044" /LENGTH=139 /DNA_ID=CAMNT_0003312839 /DNA_START=349 /DNA_END=769 /DNA_ORIENTATION=-
MAAGGEAQPYPTEAPDANGRSHLGLLVRDARSRALARVGPLASQPMPRALEGSRKGDGQTGEGDGEAAMPPEGLASSKAPDAAGDGAHHHPAPVTKLEVAKGGLDGRLLVDHPVRRWEAASTHGRLEEARSGASSPARP